MERLRKHSLMGTPGSVVSLTPLMFLNFLISVLDVLSWVAEISHWSKVSERKPEFLLKHTFTCAHTPQTNCSRLEIIKDSDLMQRW